MEKFFEEECMEGTDKLFAALLFALIAVLPLSAGGGGQQGSQGSQSGGTVSANFNPAGFPIVKEPVTKRFMIRRPPHIADPSTMITLRRYEQISGVKVNWEVVPTDGFTERVNLVMASNSMPDAIMKGVPDITKSSADGSIIDLTSLIDKYSAGIKELYRQYPAARQASMSPDGKIYALPTINTLEPNRTGHRNLWINKVWLDRLGLKAPATLDEFVAVLRAFRDKDANGNGNPSDEIPYVVEYSGGNRGARLDLFLNVWGIAANMGYGYAAIKNDRVSLFATSDEYREVLQFMNLLWKERLLDNAIYTQTADVSLSKFNSAVSGCFGLSSDDLWAKYAADYIPLPPPKRGSVTPVIGLGPVHGGSAFVITRADKTPEITLRWIDYFYTDEGSRLIGGLSPLLEGQTCKKLPDGSYEYSDAILNSPKGTAMAVGEMCPLPGGGFSYWRNVNNSNFIYSAKVRESVPVYQPYYQKAPAYAYPVFSVKDAERVNDIRRDLDVYLDECQAKFITGELSFDKWNEYTATCEKMYIKELEGFFQTAYERMK
jgi:putative aldouronate transport system substrate-binding protein